MSKEMLDNRCPNCLGAYDSDDQAQRMFEWYYCSRGNSSAHNPSPRLSLSDASTDLLIAQEAKIEEVSAMEPDKVIPEAFKMGYEAGRLDACRPEPLLAQPGELAVGRAEVDPWASLQAAADRLTSRDFNAEAQAALAASPEIAWLRQARAVMDLLASPEPPEGVVDELSTFLAPHYDFVAARSVWAWLRRQAGLEGEGL